MTQKGSSQDEAKLERNDVHDLTQGIERTRSEMSATLTALEHRLSPAELAEQVKTQLDQVEARARVLIREGLDEAKGVLAEQIESAKGAVKQQVTEAKDMVTQGLADARETVKKDIETAITTTKHAVREATIGRVENLATQAGDIMNDTRDTLVDTLRQNPIPAALAGIGIAWLLMNRSATSRRRSSGWQNGDGGGQRFGGDVRSGGQLTAGASEALHRVEGALGSAGAAISGTVREAAHGASEAIGGAVQQGFGAASHLAEQTSATARRLAHDASDATGRIVHGAADAAGQVAHRVQDFAGAAAHSAYDGASRVERGLESTLHTNPLALGAAALAVGAVVGYSLPRTQREDQLMGEVRDRLLHGAEDMARDATQSLHRLTDTAGDAAKKALAHATE
jgi:vacuolar-type H+-ATPase subunit H